MGWVCPDPGAACEAAACGDGIIAGNEVCEDDDAPPANGDGCSDTCQLEPGFKCDMPGQPCEPTFCGDGIPEGSEQCDDGNNDFGDGCTPLYCQTEPDCTLSPMMPCATSCGDGILLPNGTEECEDGNILDGDGCSQPAWKSRLCLPGSMVDRRPGSPMAADFRVTPEGGLLATSESVDWYRADGKPSHVTTTGTTSGKEFDQWYRDTAGINSTNSQTCVQSTSWRRVPVQRPAL